MYDHSYNEPFGCIKDFARLDGWEKQEVLIADNSDIIIAEFLCEKTRVKHNWPSQWHSRFSEGYIEFENRMKFELRNPHYQGKTGLYIPVD